MMRASLLAFLTWVVTATCALAQAPAPALRGSVDFAGMTAEMQSAEKPWSIQIDGDAVRFEARPGERRLKASERDRPIDRSELSFSNDNFAFGRRYAIHFEVWFEPGTHNSAKGMKFFQVHNVNDPGDFSSLGPVLALQLDRERLRIVTRADSNPVTPARPKDDWRYTDPADIERGRWYAFDIVVRFDPKEDGLLQVKRDGAELVNATGPIGYNDKVGPYAKMGVYRDTVPETAVVRFRKLAIKALD